MWAYRRPLKDCIQSFAADFHAPSLSLMTCKHFCKGGKPDSVSVGPRLSRDKLCMGSTVRFCPVTVRLERWYLLLGISDQCGFLLVRNCCACRGEGVRAAVDTAALVSFASPPGLHASLEAPGCLTPASADGGFPGCILAMCSASDGDVRSRE
jgi:hypothetical protein